MPAGSVIVDLAAGPLGGNVDGSDPHAPVVTANGTTIIGAPNLPSRMATSASQAYSRNIGTLLAHLMAGGAPGGSAGSDGGRIVIDLDDEIQRGVVVTHGGDIVHQRAAEVAAAAEASR
jgi:NAD(P) transhydrogenase subunit alpha